MWNWLKGMLGFLSFWPKNAKILFLGLDNAGKTTMLHMLKDQKLSSHQPTNHPNMEELKIGGIQFRRTTSGATGVPVASGAITSLASTPSSTSLTHMIGTVSPRRRRNWTASCRASSWQTALF